MWHIKGTPYAVQTEARNRARGQKGFAFFMEPGLGKTGVILDESTELFMEDKIDCLLVICPNSLKTNWRDEAALFGWKGECHVWPNVPDPKKMVEGQLYGILMNYEAVITRRGEEFIEQLCKYREVMGTLDESSKIKNYKSIRTKKLLALSDRMPVRRVLSGTPVTKSPADIWSQLKFVGRMPKVYHGFRNRYCYMGGYLGKQVLGPRSENLDELRNKLSEAAFLAKKRDWTDLPEKQWPLPRMFEMAPAQLQMYKDMWEDFIVQIGPDRYIEAPMAITQMMKLQQITSGFVIDDAGTVIPLFEDAKSNPKIQLVEEILEEVPGKVIHFTVARYSTQLLYDHLKSMGRNPAIIRGGMTDGERDTEKKLFNNESSCRDIVCQITSGGIGLTLLGQPGVDRCSTTIYFENSYDLEARLQSEDRNHRHGQDEMVTYYDLACSPSDRKMKVALQRKENIANLVTDPKFWSEAEST